MAVQTVAHGLEPHGHAHRLLCAHPPRQRLITLTSETAIDAIARAREAITKGGKALLSRLRGL